MEWVTDPTICFTTADNHYPERI